MWLFAQCVLGQAHKITYVIVLLQRGNVSCSMLSPQAWSVLSRGCCSLLCVIYWTAESMKEVLHVGFCQLLAANTLSMDMDFLVDWVTEWVTEWLKNTGCASVQKNRAFCLITAAFILLSTLMSILDVFLLKAFYGAIKAEWCGINENAKDVVFNYRSKHTLLNTLDLPASAALYTEISRKLCYGRVPALVPTFLFCRLCFPCFCLYHLKCFFSVFISTSFTSS